MRWHAIVLVGASVAMGGKVAAQSCLQAPMRTGERALALRASAARSMWQLEGAWLQRSLTYSLGLMGTYGQLESAYYDAQNDRAVRVSGHALQAGVELSLPLDLLGLECIAAAAAIGGSRTPFQDVVHRTSTVAVQFSSAFSVSAERSGWFFAPYLAPDLSLGRTALSQSGARYTQDDYFAAPGVEVGVLLRSGRVMIAPSFHWSMTTLGAESYPLDWRVGKGGTLLAVRVGLVL